MTHQQELAAILAPEHGLKAEAMSLAYDRFCQHHNRPLFEAEVQAIRDCRVVDYMEYGR